jgi:hypothetical protein
VGRRPSAASSTPGSSRLSGAGQASRVDGARGEEPAPHELHGPDPEPEGLPGGLRLRQARGTAPGAADRGVREVRPLLPGEAQPLQGALYIRGQSPELSGARADGGPDRLCPLPGGEGPETRELYPERAVLPARPVERRVHGRQGIFRHLAEELQGEVDVLRRQPADLSLVAQAPRPLDHGLPDLRRR